MNDELDFNKTIISLAPLAGYTDLPFRSVVKEFGVDYTVSEMISSNALAYNSEKTFKMLEKASNENPYFVQLSGSKSDIMRIAVEKLNEIDGIAGIDLNCGCPAPKVFNHGSGSSLLGDLPRLKDILYTIKETSNKTYLSVKVRIGIDKKIPSLIAEAINEVGVDMISVHGRTKQGAYKSSVDYDAIKEIVEISNSPVIANGNITDYQKAKYVLEYTKASGVMIGRGAIGNPWIFWQIKYNKKEITNDIKKEIILEHYDKMIEFYGSHGVAMFRKHTHTYSKGYKGASILRNDVNRISDIKEYRDVIDNFFKNNEMV